MIFLLKNIVPENSGLAGGAIAVAIMAMLVFFILLLGLILTKVFIHKFSYFLVFTATLGVIVVFIVWNVQSLMMKVEYRRKIMENNEIGSQISLNVDNCKIKNSKHPIYDYQIYNLICNVALNNLELIKKTDSKSKDLLQIFYSKSLEDLPSEWKMSFVKKTNESFELEIELGKNPQISNIYIRSFVLNRGFDRYVNENLNLKLELDN